MTTDTRYNVKYNVYVVAIHDKNDVTLIGSDMNAEQAEKRVMTGLMRCDRDNYFVGDYEVGSTREIELARVAKH